MDDSKHDSLLDWLLSIFDTSDFAGQLSVRQSVVPQLRPAIQVSPDEIDGVPDGDVLPDTLAGALVFDKGMTIGLVGADIGFRNTILTGQTLGAMSIILAAEKRGLIEAESCSVMAFARLLRGDTEPQEKVLASSSVGAVVKLDGVKQNVPARFTVAP